MTTREAIEGLKACPDHCKLWVLDPPMTAALGRPVLDIGTVFEVFEPLMGKDESIEDAAARLYGELFRESLRYLLGADGGPLP